MQSFPSPFNEPGRLAALHRLEVLDTPPEPLFDRAVEMARRLLEAPTALVSLVDRDRQWFKARCGLDVEQTGRDASICAHAILDDEVLVAPDALADPRFAQNPVVTGPPNVRFYVGAPITLSDGFRVGTVCVLDYVPRPAPERWRIDLLRNLAAMVAAALERRGGEVVAAEPQPHMAAAQEEFLALVSHELRTPLNGVLGLASVIAEEAPDDTCRSMARSIGDSGRHLLGIVERILSFSDARAGELRLRETSFDPVAALEAAASLTRASAMVSGKEVVVSRAPAPPLQGDEAQVRQVLACLIDNALVHGGRRIGAEARVEPDGGLSFVVADDGAGVAVSALARVMDPFAIGEEVYSRAGQGIGLGLALSSRLVAMHGGALSIERALGETRAVARFPAWRVAAAAGRPPKGSGG